jgi:single-strand DNA-binding protein
MNKVMMIGRLTANPELRQTQSGIAACRFTIAVDRGFKDKNGERQADFINCMAWRQTAEFISRYFSKGKMIAIEGQLRTGSYKDKKYSDVTHYTTDVYVDGVEFCGDKDNKPTPAQQPSTSYSTESEFEEILSDGDVPF